MEKLKIAEFELDSIKLKDKNITNKLKRNQWDF